MAGSPSHQFGQFIGDLIESLMEPKLEDFCKEHNLFLDHHKKERTARKKKVVTWIDSYGNKHNLDYVIEKQGDDSHFGNPVAFIEVAWRRYTKHSRNKAQEIQGAILPLSEKYHNYSPFLGTILAGVFTEGAVQELKSTGFSVLHFPYQQLITAFATVGININFTEETPDNVFLLTTNKLKTLSNYEIESIKSSLLIQNAREIDEFFAKLEKRFTRYIIKIYIIPLYGKQYTFSNVTDASCFIDTLSANSDSREFAKFEVSIEYSNNDKLFASLHSKEEAKNFLSYAQNN